MLGTADLSEVEASLIDESILPVDAAKELRSTFCQRIVSILDDLDGDKATYWDISLMEPLALITDTKIFKDKGAKEFFILNRQTDARCSSLHVLFFIKSSLEALENVRNHVDSFLGGSEGKIFYLFFIPEQSISCLERLKEFGFQDCFKKIEILPLYLFPLDKDLFSMEYHRSFSELFVDDDISHMGEIVNSIILLQSFYGRTRSSKALGTISKKILTVLEKRQNPANPYFENSYIDELILFDRTCDELTPFITPVSYEGLLDELITINGGSCLIPFKTQDASHKTDKPGQSSTEKMGMRKVRLFPAEDADSDVYGLLKAQEFFEVGRILTDMTRELTKEIDEDKKSSNVSQMRKLVSKLPRVNAKKLQLALHTTIAEILKEQIDKTEFRERLEVEHDLMRGFDLDGSNPNIDRMLALRDSFSEVIKLICIQSLLSGGLKPRVFEHYCHSICLAYGVDKLIPLVLLDKCGIFTTKGKQRPHKGVQAPLESLLKEFRCTPVLDSNQNKKLKTKYPQFYTDYDPLSVKLIEYLFNFDKGKKNDLKYFAKDFKALSKMVIDSNVKESTERVKTVLVYFVGGCNYSEINILRNVFKKKKNVNLLIGTTNVLRSDSILKQLSDVF